ncbi:MAG: phosphomannomutase/phosphoglucomutase [Anaerolineae bacterium]|nr:phosphomannomutase/phosphoglucomutase [Anaerolineae bacterium]
MDISIFRAYSIRGIADQTLTAGDMRLIGQATGTLLAEQGIDRAVVGRDVRVSSLGLSAALIDGLLATGLHLIDIHTCVTPMLNWATDHYEAGAGLMVTASHNPADYNGLKIRTDHSLGDQELARIYHVAASGRFRQEQGTLTHHDPTADYLAAISNVVQIGQPLRVVVDAGNGAACDLSPALIKLLGCKVIPLYCEPDGRFPNRIPDPTAPGALDALSARVVEERADAGLGYDGDGDRLAMVDERGRVVFGDQLLTLLAQQALCALKSARTPKGARTPEGASEYPGATVVYELSCTQALQETVEALGGTAIPCPVGYAFVHEAMRRHSALLGGEAAGHLFFDQPGFLFDDAMLATARMLALLGASKRPFSALLADLPQYHLSPEHRFQCPDHLKQPVVQAVQSHFADQGFAIERMDGAKIHFGDGWALFRPSNTQPAVTLRCEAKTKVRLETIECLMLDVVRDVLTTAGITMRNAH